MISLCGQKVRVGFGVIFLAAGKVFAAVHFAYLFESALLAIEGRYTGEEPSFFVRRPFEASRFDSVLVGAGVSGQPYPQTAQFDLHTREIQGHFDFHTQHFCHFFQVVIIRGGLLPFGVCPGLAGVLALFGMASQEGGVFGVDSLHGGQITSVIGMVQHGEAVIFCLRFFGGGAIFELDLLHKC
jgi:hypothetical protein